MTTNAAIHLHIERLVLEGLPVAPRQGALVQAALEAELARLLREGGLAPAWRADGAAPSASADAVQLAGESDPAQVGRQIARAVYGGLRP